MDNYINNIVSQSALQSQTANAQSAKLKAAQNREEIVEKSKEFEAMFISQMLNLMFKDVAADPLFGDQASDKIYQSMLLDEYGKSIAENGGFGIADQVQAELLKLQEVQ